MPDDAIHRRQDSAEGCNGWPDAHRDTAALRTEDKDRQGAGPSHPFFEPQVSPPGAMVLSDDYLPLYLLGWTILHPSEFIDFVDSGLFSASHR